MGLILDHAKPQDIDELLKLYFSVYGSNYPIAAGTDPLIMAQTISSQDHIWLLSRDVTNNVIAGSCLFAIDRSNKIGKVSALVVHPDYRKQHISRDLVVAGCDHLLKGSTALNSIYTTTRTVSVKPQLLFLKNGFLPLGIFPNAHKLRDYETLTLFAKHRDGVLGRRETVRVIPEKLAGLASIVNQNIDHQFPDTNHPLITPDLVGTRRISNTPPDDDLNYETLFAPHFVKKRFFENVPDPYDRFYPFHTPNTLFASTNGELEVYAYLSKVDHYSTIVSLTVPVHNLFGRMKSLLNSLKEAGASYVEILIGMEHTASIEALLEAQFLPSAVYPAMQERDNRFFDYVLMSRTMEPLNFKGMEIASAFKPYVDQYVDLWKKMHLDTLEIFNDYK